MVGASVISVLSIEDGKFSETGGNELELQVAGHRRLVWHHLPNPANHQVHFSTECMRLSVTPPPPTPLPHTPNPTSTDVLILLRDKPRYQTHAVDASWGFGLRTGSSLPQGQRRELQTGSVDSTAREDDTAELGDELLSQQWALEKVAAREAWNVSRGAWEVQQEYSEW